MNRDIQLRDVRISFEELGDGEKTILFIHGNSQSSEAFKNQLSSSSFPNCKLIALDLPGHGNSPIPIKPENVFSIPGYAALVAEFVNALNLERVVLVGHSLGGHIAIESLPLTDKIIGLAVCGTPPIEAIPDFGAMFLPHPSSQLLYKEHFSPDDLHVLSDGFFNQNLDLNHPLIQDLRNTAPIARTQLLANIVLGKFGNELQQLAEANIPTLMLCGEKDQLINQTYLNQLPTQLLYNGRVHYLKGASHSAMIDAHSEFNDLLLHFISNL